MTDQVIVTDDGPVRMIRMNRPEKKNALTSVMYDAMAEAIEPHVATHIFNEMLKEAKIEPLFGQRLEKLLKKGASITALQTVKGDTFTARVFIAASYEGNVMTAAGVEYIELLPAPAGEEGLVNRIDAAAEVGLWEPIYRQRLVDAARGARNETKEAIFADLNKKWADARASTS